MRAGAGMRERAACWGTAPLIRAVWVRAEAKQSHSANPHIASRIMPAGRARAWRLFAAGALAGAGLGLAGPALAQTVTSINVSTASDLVGAIQTVDHNPAGNYNIVFQNNITLSAVASNTLAALDTRGNVTIEGNGYTLNAGGAQRGFFVYSGNVSIRDLTIQNAQALGGSGGSLGGGGGGGGAGAGGALFVASGAAVTVSNVTLIGSNASGGAGGAGGAGTSGGQGIGGNGGAGPSGGNGFGDGGNGGLTGGRTSGAAGPGASGGFGGGGGGGGNILRNASGGAGGPGGFAAGGGGQGGNGDANDNSGGSGGGGGGAGLGGAVFVQNGGTLTIGGSFSVNGSSVTGGAGPGRCQEQCSDDAGWRWRQWLGLRLRRVPAG
jgi:hypothetical protein